MCKDPFYLLFEGAQHLLTESVVTILGGQPIPTSEVEFGNFTALLKAAMTDSDREAVRKAFDKNQGALQKMATETRQVRLWLCLEPWSSGPHC